MRSSLLLAAILVATPALAQTPIDPKAQARIDRILKATPLIDGHNDLPWALRQNYDSRIDGLASGTASRPTPLMTDMARLKAGRVGTQLWSVYISAATKGDEAIRQTIEQIDIVDRLVKAYPRDLEWARTADDIVRIHRTGRIASMVGIEGGDQVANNLAALRQFYRLGTRYMTLTHSKTTDWADSATDDPKHGGLSPFGVKVVGEMNRLGVLVDLSHVSPDAMKDALAVSRSPVIFSHSNARALVDHPRNVPDDVLRMVPANGAVVMVTFVPRFLSTEAWLGAAARDAEEARLKTLIPESSERVRAELAKWDAAHPAPPVLVAAVADHVEHVARIAGHDHVGLGGDFDGITDTVRGLDGVEDYPNLFAELIRRGWSDADLAKLAGGNFLRALRGAEATARAMASIPPAMDRLPPAP